jgi:hypothetical protein
MIYAVEISFTIHADDDKQAVKKGEDFVRDLDYREDNRARLNSVYRKVEGLHYTPVMLMGKN